MIPESQLHYIWANRLFDSITLEGQEVEVIEAGQLNSHDGPDFEMCHLRVGGLEWVGSVEMHRKASEWEAHQHQCDPRYASVVLHVVLEADRRVYDLEGREVPTAVMVTAPAILEYLSQLEEGNKSLRCMPEMTTLGAEHILDTALQLLEERVWDKLAKLRARSDTDHFNSIFYLTLMRYVGVHQNNEVMEQVAHSLPYSYLKKHASDPLSLEAMLLGQAGLLSETPRDEYEERLLGEYSFYREKFGLTPLPSGRFRYLRLRPPSFPTRMLGIVAMIIHHEEELLSAVAGLDKASVLRVLRVAPSEYWQSHFDFGREMERPHGGIGQQTLKSLVINAIIPATCHYAGRIGDPYLAQRALDWLYVIGAEQNQYVKLFEQNGIVPRHAADSQSLLQLYHGYCAPMHCLHCPLAIDYFRAIHDR